MFLLYRVLLHMPVRPCFYCIELYCTCLFTHVSIDRVVLHMFVHRCFYCNDCAEQAVPVFPLNLTCPVFSRIATDNSLDVDIDYMKYRQCSCMPNTYVQFLPLRCLACPSRLNCSQSLVSPLHVVQPGFFPVFTDASIVAAVAFLVSNIVNASVCTDLFLPATSKRGVVGLTVVSLLALDYLRDCQIASNISAMVVHTQLLLRATNLRCRTTIDCPGITTLDSTSIFACAVGRNSDSLLCSQCIPGYYLTSNRNCLICPSDFKWLAPLVNCVIAAVVLIMLWKHSFSKGRRSRSIFQVTMFWLQVNDVFGTSNRKLAFVDLK